MARATSGLGQFRGKVGSVVFRVNQGQQIASAYQPAVKNPKSNLQTAQRNKMYLASQLSKLVPREDIIGLAPRGTVRDRRAMFIKNIIDSATSSLNNGLFTSSIDVYKLKFSSGNALSGLSVSTSGDGQGSINNLNLTFDKNFISEDVFNRIAIKVVQIDFVDNRAINYKSSWLDLGVYNTGGSEDTFTKQIAITTSDDASAAIIVIPVEVAENVRYSSERKTLVQAGTNEEVILIQGEYAINRAVLNWHESISAGFVGVDVPIIPPSADGDEVVNPDGPNFPNLG